MKRQYPASLLLFCLIFVGASASSAQQPPPAENEALHKKACDYVTKSEAESILGTTVALKTDSPFGCWFQSVGFADKQVNLNVWFWSSPLANRFAAVKRGLLDYPMPSQVVTELPGLGDAALWQWIPGVQGTLYAFKGGTIQVKVDIGGLSEATTLENAKALAAKALGGAGGTGYLYRGTPKGDAALAAAATAAATTEAAATAKLIQQGKTFSQAPYITESQFLKSLKEVSLTFQTDPSLAKYISPAEQRSNIVSALGGYGIAVRPGAPVTLQATVVHKPYRYEVKSGAGNIHELEVALKLLVKAGAWRNGQFYVVEASPAYESYFVDLIDGDFARSVDDTVKRIKDAFNENVAASFKSIASNTKPETTPWSVNSWTARDKSIADAEFTRIMSSQSPVKKRQLDGIDSAPVLILDPTNNGDRCTAPNSSWRDSWSKAFQRVGWDSVPAQPTLQLRHFFRCYFNYPPTSVLYFWYFDTISLVEKNLVFELNGALVRRPGELLYLSHSAHSTAAETPPPMQDFLPRSINDFLVDLAVGRASR